MPSGNYNTESLENNVNFKLQQHNIHYILKSEHVVHLAVLALVFFCVCVCGIILEKKYNNARQSTLLLRHINTCDERSKIKLYEDIGCNFCFELKCEYSKSRYCLGVVDLVM